MFKWIVTAFVITMGTHHHMLNKMLISVEQLHSNTSAIQSRLSNLERQFSDQAAVVARMTEETVELSTLNERVSLTLDMMETTIKQAFPDTNEVS